MNRSLSIALILALTSWCMAQQPRLVPDEVRARITDDEANPLPKYRTEAERLLPLPGHPWRTCSGGRRPGRSIRRRSTSSTTGC